MAATKRWITIARPGTFHYSWGDENKTAEDLKEAVAFSPLLRLTMGHPKGGRTRRRDFLGFVKPKWNESLQAVEGMAWFYEEHFDKIPENIRRKIVNFEPYKISPGFTLDDESDTGAQKGTMFDHVAILRDGENPICPLDQCGVNVRLESESMPKMIYEQEQTVENKDTNTTAKVEPESPQLEASSEVEALKAEVAELKSLLSLSQKQPQPSEPEPEIKVEEKGPEVSVEEKAEVLPPEPEMVIPAGIIPSEAKAFKVDDDGWIRMELPSEEQENE